jgi:hypothetical protein
MRWASLALAALLSLGACGGGGAIAEVDLLVAVDVGSRSVSTGQGFLLTVTRIWRKDIEPSPWDDGVLSPLVVRAQGVQTREDRLRVEEVRTFRAYAFGLDPVTIPPVLCVGRSVGGSGRVLARSEAVELDVVPTLPPESPGVPELPEVPAAQMPEGLWWSVGIVLVLVLILVSQGLMRRRPASGHQPPLDPVAEARTKLQALLTARAEGAPALHAGSEGLRRAVASRFKLSTATRTTEELLPLVPARWRADLGRVLIPADLAKFADWEPDAEASRRVLSGMLAFIDGLAPVADGGGTP